ncbi:MAG: LysR family transcriptional regulator [Ottowia sp.]|uniref:LysR family transcriptional regulator n=1 Tax=Ottowia sp. TaxID=1898956 RepID=UPI003C75A264
MDWDLLRYFLELARTGRLTAAARRLDVDHTTVSRRVQALEKKLGTTLFVRTSSGMDLTEEGRLLLPEAEAMESAAARVQGHAEQPANELGGVVRVGATEGFGSAVLAPYLASFAASHPRLTIDLVAVSAIVSISRREADIVISLERPRRGPFVVTKLCDYVLLLYGARTYLAKHPPLKSLQDLKHHSLIGYVDDLLFSKQLQFVNEIDPPERFTLRSTSIAAQLNATAAGGGLSVLPAFLADPEPRLEPVLEQEVRFQRTFWMSMPEEVKQVPRIRQTWDYLRKMIDAEKSLLMAER